VWFVLDGQCADFDHSVEELRVLDDLGVDPFLVSFQCFINVGTGSSGAREIHIDVQMCVGNGTGKRSYFVEDNVSTGQGQSGEHNEVLDFHFRAFRSVGY